MRTVIRPAPSRIDMPHAVPAPFVSCNLKWDECNAVAKCRSKQITSSPARGTPSPVYDTEVHLE